MPEYRRAQIKGGTYFLTLVTYQRQRIFSMPSVRTLLFDAIHQTRKFNPFFKIAHCILPDHIHYIWQLPEGDSNYSTRISVMKRHFSKYYIETFGLPISKDTSRNKRREVTVWQRRFWEHYIRDEEDLNRHIDYVHYNPVKHEWASRVRDWPDSSFFEYVDAGYYDLDWGDNLNIEDQQHQFGE
jgi:putative transposase